MTTIHDYEMTNTCICTDEDENPTDHCWGDCWDWQVEQFAEDTKHLFEKNEEGYWNIGGIRLWNREVGGIAECRTPIDLIRAMTVNAEWTMRYTVHPECIEYSLSHHDAPMGSASFVRIATEEEIEESYGW
jgi:hypothetical protein